MGNTVIKLAAGALIPAFANIVFNLLNFAFENSGKNPLPDFEPSTFDIAPGCVFSIIGMCVAAKEHATSNKLMVVSVALILLTITLDLLIPFFLHYSKFPFVYFVDFISLIASCWAIKEAG